MNNELTGDVVPPVESARPGSTQTGSVLPKPEHSEAAAMALATAAGTQPKANREAARPSDAMADLHLSGSDPRMFPGIFTRDQRSGSLRNLAQAGDWPVDSSETPGEEDDM